MPVDPRDNLICTSADDVGEGPQPVSYPIAQTSLFVFDSTAELADGLDDEFRNAVYTRGRNPTVSVLETKLSQLEQGEACKVFASGMGAISAVLLSFLKSGDHIVFVNHVYGPTMQLVDHLHRFGIDYDVVAASNQDKLEQVIKPETRLIWLESPGTMLFELVDIERVVDIARQHSIKTVMDNTWSTPLFQKPLTMGVDIVVHSATKYLGGHGDLVAGALVSTEEILEKVFYRAFLLNGAAIGPFDAWLVTRGLRTLPVRMLQHELAGKRVASYLNDHPRVESVFHPAISGDTALVEKQLTGTSGLLSFMLKDGDYEAICRFLDSLNVFRLGVSWGGFESLAISPNRGSNMKSLREQGLPSNLVRLSVGQENVDVLLSDLEQALGA